MCWLLRSVLWAVAAARYGRRPALSANFRESRLQHEAMHLLLSARGRGVRRACRIMMRTMSLICVRKVTVLPP